MDAHTDIETSKDQLSDKIAELLKDIPECIGDDPSWRGLYWENQIQSHTKSEPKQK